MVEGVAKIAQQGIAATQDRNLTTATKNGCQGWRTMHGNWYDNPIITIYILATVIAFLPVLFICWIRDTAIGHSKNKDS